MIKLYFSPSACSLASHIALREAGLEYELEKVDLRSKKTASGADFRAINPKGYVPALMLDNGQLLTECAAVLQYVGDQNPSSGLTPKASGFERYRLQEWLNYLATEVHKVFGPLFSPKLTAEQKQATLEVLGSRFDYLSKTLEGHPHLMGDGFSVADGYLFTLLRWTQFTGVDMAKWPALTAYMDRIGERAAVKAALEAEAKAS